MNQDNIAIIDADSIVWITAYNNRDNELFAESLVKNSFDNLFKAILLYSKATHYAAAFSDSTENNVRTPIYKYAEYKGKRPPTPEFMVKWGGIIKEHAYNTWGVLFVPGYEADDIVSTLQTRYNKAGLFNTVCSIDKDLRQQQGYYYDYKKLENEIVYVPESKALFNFYNQMLMGDTTDNIAGIPKIGEKKAKEILKDCTDFISYEVTVKEEYNKAFGKYYGPIIHEQTYFALKLHNLDVIARNSKFHMPEFTAALDKLVEFTPLPVPEIEGIDVNALKELGWA